MIYKIIADDQKRTANEITESRIIQQFSPFSCLATEANMTLLETLSFCQEQLGLHIGVGKYLGQAMSLFVSKNRGVKTREFEGSEDSSLNARVKGMRDSGDKLLRHTLL